MDSATHNQLLIRLDALLAQLELCLDQEKPGNTEEAARPKDSEKLISTGNCQSQIKQARAALAELKRLADSPDRQAESGKRRSDVDAVNLEQRLRAEIERLRAEGQEKHSLLHSRNEEVLHAKAELDQLSARFSELEMIAMQSAAEAVAESELSRTEFQAQLALLQAELSQKEWALQEKQAIIDGLEQRFAARIVKSQLQSSAGKNPSEHPDGGFLLTRPTAYGVEDGSAAVTRQPIVNCESESPSRRNHGRKWRMGGVSKRRWRLPKSSPGS